MAERGSSKVVRVVRCPKCQMLLPEPPNSSVYRCGACDALLQAKMQNGAIGSSSSNKIGESDMRKQESPREAAVDNSSDVGLEESVALDASLDSERSKVQESGKDASSRPSKSPPLIELKLSAAKLAKQDWRDGGASASLGGHGRTPKTQYSMREERSTCSRPNRVEDLERDRVEILRKLDDLREQLRQSCDHVTEKPIEHSPSYKRTVASGRNRSHGLLFSGGSTSLGRASSSQHSPYLDEHSTDSPNFYPAMHPSEIPSYHSEPFLPKPIGMAPPCHQRPQGSYLYSKNQAFPCHHEGFYLQPACSCLHCYQTSYPPAAFQRNRLSYRVDNPMFDQEAIAANSYDLKATVARKNGRQCRPVAGAAPFVVCHSCSKLLQLPPMLLLGRKNRWKLCCGSCSKVILLKFDGKRLMAVSSESEMRPSNEGSRLDGTNEKLRVYGDSSNYHVTHDSGKFRSQSEDSGSAEERSVLRPLSYSSHELLVEEFRSNSSDSAEIRGCSPCSSRSDGGQSCDNIICQGDATRSTSLPCEEDEYSSHVQIFPPFEYFGNLESNDMTEGQGSMSRRSDQEEIVRSNGNFIRKNSVKDPIVASEMDLSSDESPDSVFSRESPEARKVEDDHPRSKGRESFFAGLMKKSFKDLISNRSMENGRSKVSINGHHISDRLVKKAEKQAGPIHPGEYWYDYRAGFWGSMGHPCLGIIPPFIEEFNYPMPRSCSGGDTGILVNGRELHRDDLDLLSGRGLPNTPGRSYIIEISGKIWDETSMEELNGLGKLAPTVERAKHGFGMRRRPGIQGIPLEVL